MAAMPTLSLASETIGQIGSFPIRNSLLVAWVAVLTLSLIAVLSSRKGYREIPGRFQALLELIVEGLFSFFDTILHDRALTRRVFPLIATLFLFLLAGNWLGIFPGIGSITIDGMHEGHAATLPLLRSMNADINMTLALALVAIGATHVFGIRSLGLKTHVGKFFVAPWKSPLKSFIGMLELLAEAARITSFTFRLFGNIFAGEVLLAIVSGLLPLIVPLPFLGLEIFVGFIQALLFALLTLVFLHAAVSVHVPPSPKEA